MEGANMRVIRAAVIQFIRFSSYSPNMAWEAFSECLILKLSSGSMPLDPPNLAHAMALPV